MAAPKLPLNNGFHIPTLGLGTYSGEGIENVIVDSIAEGYQLIDTAFVYNNEPQIGVGLKKVLNEGKVKREDLFIVSKLWNTRHQPANVLPSIKQSLKDLQLDYLDLYLMHWPFAMKEGSDPYEIFNRPEEDIPFEDTWLAMEECVKQGHAKSIGVSNFNSEQLARLLKIATIKPVVNQVECNPYLIQEELQKFCKDNNIVMMAYSPFFAPGRLGSTSYGLNIFEEPVIKELAAKYNKQVNQIVLRYLVQCGVVPIPKTDKKDRLRSNFDVFDFTLSSTDFEKMRALNKNLRCTMFPSAEKFKEYPF